MFRFLKEHQYSNPQRTAFALLTCIMLGVGFYGLMWLQNYAMATLAPLVVLCSAILLGRYKTEQLANQRLAPIEVLLLLVAAVCIPVHLLFSFSRLYCAYFQMVAYTLSIIASFTTCVKTHSSRGSAGMSMLKLLFSDPDEPWEDEADADEDYLGESSGDVALFLFLLVVLNLIISILFGVLCMLGI